MGSAAFSLAARRGRCKAVQRQCGLGRSVGLGEIKRRFSASQTRTAFSLSPYAGFLSFFRRLFLSFVRKREKRPSGLKLPSAAREAVNRSCRGKAGGGSLRGQPFSAAPHAARVPPYHKALPLFRRIKKPPVSRRHFFSCYSACITRPTTSLSVTTWEKKNSSRSRELTTVTGLIWLSTTPFCRSDSR